MEVRDMDKDERISKLAEYLAHFVQQAEDSHYKCYIGTNEFCYNEQYGDGNGDDHEVIREARALLDSLKDGVKS
jgi:hypothetical protein